MTKAVNRAGASPHGRVAGEGRDRFGPLLVHVATFLRTLFDPDNLWVQHLRLWELRRIPDETEAVAAWLASHVLPMSVQIVMQGLSALQQTALTGYLLSDRLYDARRALIELLGALVITTPVHGRQQRAERARQTSRSPGRPTPRRGVGKWAWR